MEESMNLQEAIEKFKKYQAKISAYGHAIGMLHYDAETCMPKGASDNLGKTLGILSEEGYKIRVSEELKEILEVLKKEESSLDPQTKKELELVIEGREKTEKIPMEEYVEYQIIRNAAGQAWQKAKAASDYELFKPSLEKLITYSKKFAKYEKPEEDNIYNTMLDDYEKGMTTDILDTYFSQVRESLVPLIAKITEKPAPRVDFLERSYPIEGQAKMAQYLMDVLGLDKNYCVLGETEHPFSMHFSNKDVRITTHYYENNLASSFFSVIHEGGHGMYELNTGDHLSETVLSSGTSMGIHESQSRFWENIVGRSHEFCTLVFPKLQEVFPEQLSDVTVDEFYKAINMSSPSLIRIEADELTYSLHVMIRYEMEKRMMLEDISVDELPAMWNKLYKEYLGVDVPDDAHGILQDVHWSGGMFGYFPSYSIGSAYASQITASLKEDLDLEALVQAGTMAPITEWLTEHIYQYGKMLTPAEVIQNCCKKDFDPKYYVEYLSKKYSELYQI